MISQKRIAAEVGLERSTVSLALRNDPRIPEATRQRVQEAADRLGYTPNPLLSEMARRRWKGGALLEKETIAFIQTVADEHPMIAPARAHANRLGYRLEPVDPAELKTDRRLSDVLRSRGIRGVLFEQMTLEDRIRELEWDQFSVVQCGLLARTTWHHRVGVDLIEMINRSAEEAWSRGYKKVGFLLPMLPGLYSDQILRQAAYGLQKEMKLTQTMKIIGGVETPQVGNPEQEIRALGNLVEQGCDAIIGSGNGSYQILEKIAKAQNRKVAYACLFRKPGHDTMSGFIEHEPLLAVHGVELMVQRLRTHVRGLPKVMTHLALTPEWVEGKTL